jgi:hypothetical protein
MASLANVSPGSSYPGLLKTENNTGITGSLQTITDGEGTVLPLQLSCDFITNYGNGAVTSNTVFGQNALAANTTGAGISAFGNNALKCNTTGSFNNSIGLNALYSNTTGSNNEAIGVNALYNNTTGGCNTAIGQGAMYFNTVGGANIAVGRSSLEANITGNENISIGRQALASNISGSQNVAIGRSSLLGHTGGSQNTAIGFATRSGNFSTSVILGACATATANNQFVVGATGAFNAGAITVESVSPTHTWQVRINGQNYKIPLIPV